MGVVNKKAIEFSPFDELILPSGDSEELKFIRSAVERARKSAKKEIRNIDCGNDVVGYEFSDNESVVKWVAAGLARKANWGDIYIHVMINGYDDGVTFRMLPHGEYVLSRSGITTGFKVVDAGFLG